jgi:hypothetical protein
MKGLFGSHLEAMVLYSEQKPGCKAGLFFALADSHLCDCIRTDVRIAVPVQSQSKNLSC